MSQSEMANAPKLGRPVFWFGWALVILVIAGGLGTTKGGPQWLFVSGVTSGVLSLAGLATLKVLGRTQWRSYPPGELRFIATPYVVGTVVMVGLAISYAVLVLVWNNVL